MLELSESPQSSQYPSYETAMNFSSQEIELARSLRQRGIPWEPEAGNYVYDLTGFCKQKSPFQERVYFILNYPYFMRNVGGVDRFKEIMLWLPTWENLRDLLRVHGISDQQVSLHLAETQAIENGTERLALYQLAEATFTSQEPPIHSSDRESLQR
ncbi:hypothetical protein [Neorhodopirellula lusitana]|nr:hypothetical protein [Neorhodopirellula lusitana]